MFEIGHLDEQTVFMKGRFDAGKSEQATKVLEAIRLVEGSDLPAKRSLSQLGVSKSTFYEWYRRYQEEGAAGLLARPSQRRPSTAAPKST